jgi:predicted deacetylase
MQALISVHDVWPQTLARVARIVDGLRAQGHHAITLLVVPGAAWPRADLDRLARWQREGIELAGHGWHHRCESFGGLGHRVHAALVSRRAAEHLALDGPAIEALMRATHDWFARHGLTPPASYVPPAWALGRMEPGHLAHLPYRQVEVMRGLIDTASGELWPLPLVGFEADSGVRAIFLRRWNAWQQRRAHRHGDPLRIAIHPHDPNLRLARDLRHGLARDWQSQRYDDWSACQRTRRAVT